MSTSTRRKSHNSIQKTARLRSKKAKHSKRDKRSSTNSIRSHSPQQYRSHSHYSHQSIQPPQHHNQSHIQSYHSYSHGHGLGHHNHDDYSNAPSYLYDVNDDEYDIHNLPEEDSPPIRPTHKKNAVSSFLSIFSTFSQSKQRRRDSNQSDTIDNMTDLELLKKMKRRILNILSKMIESKRLKKIKSELKSQVWEVEYSELKKRLSTHDIHTATIKQKLASAKSLKQLQSIENRDGNGNDDDNSEDIREMATFLLSEYFDQPNQSNQNQPDNQQKQKTKKNKPQKRTQNYQKQKQKQKIQIVTNIDEYELKNEIDKVNSHKSLHKSYKYSPRPQMNMSQISPISSPIQESPPIELDNNNNNNNYDYKIDNNNNNNNTNNSDSSNDEEEEKSQSSTSFYLIDNFLSDNLIKALSKIGTWEFDPFQFFQCIEIGGHGLVYSVWYLFDKYNLFKIFPSLSMKKFMKFLHFIEDGYLDNPYHNKIHATDVVSNVAYYLNHTDFFNKHISPFDKFTAILSAAVHDLGHDGNNNTYHITTMSDLAITYNDISVLENYHIAQTFKILKKTQCNWFKILNKPIKRYLRLAMIDIVLATDMKFHNQKLAQLTNLVAILKQQLNEKTNKLNNINNNRDSIMSIQSIQSTPTPSAYSHSIDGSISEYNTLSDFPLYKYKVNENGCEHLLTTEINDIIINDSDPRVIDVNDERRFILCFLVHLCDISSCAKDLKSGKKWAVRVMTEFFKQGDRERALGLEVSAMMDRRRSSTPQGQIGFIKFILKPSYNMFVRLVPEANKPLEILNENLQFWQIQQKLMTQERKKRARSVGSLNQNPVLMSFQKELKKLEHTQIENIMENENENESDDFIDDDTSNIKQNNNNNIKRVGFKEQLIIQKPPNDDDDDDDDNELIVETPRTLSSKSLNININNMDNNNKNHTTQQSNGSYYSNGHSSNKSRNTNISIDSLDSEKINTTKLRAHSIHVSIPTSEKQIQSQPQPFSEFLAELRKEWEQKEDEKYQRDQNKKKRRERTIILMKTNKNNGPRVTTPKPKVTQSVSSNDHQTGSVVAQISVDIQPQNNNNDTNNNNNNNNNNSTNNNNNKQVFDVV